MMKKTIIITAVFIGLLLFAGGYAHRGYKAKPGETAPKIADTQIENVIRKDLDEGCYVLVNFWNSSDAESRKSANIYRAWKRRFDDANLKIIGVNFDNSERLFHEIVRLDSLEPAAQFHVSDKAAKAIINDYGLKSGYGAVLIDPRGKIVSVNPSEIDLDAAFATHPRHKDNS